MAQELFTNGAASTLSGAIDSSTTSIGVVSGAAFPALGNFRIRIDDEILLATSRASNTISATRGQEGTTAASHSSGAAVKQILTAAFLRRATMEVGDSLTVSGAHGAAQGHTCAVQSAAHQATARGYQALARLPTALVEASGLPSGWAQGDAQRIRISAAAETSSYTPAYMQHSSQGLSPWEYLPMPASCTWLAYLRLLGVDAAGSIAAWDLHFIAQSSAAGDRTGIIHAGGATNITPNVASEFGGRLTIQGNAGSGAAGVSLIVSNTTSGLTTRWHGALDITELITLDTGYGYGY